MKTIYAICDSKTNEVKYVGQTKNYIRRTKDHERATINGHFLDIYEWMRQNEYYFKELVIVEDFMANETEYKTMNLYNNTILNVRRSKYGIANNLSKEALERKRVYLISVEENKKSKFLSTKLNNIEEVIKHSRFLNKLELEKDNNWVLKRTK